jgi:hypothetical protein
MEKTFYIALKYVAIFLAGGIGLLQTVTDFKDKTGKLNRFGRIAVVTSIVALFVAVISQTVELRMDLTEAKEKQSRLEKQMGLAIDTLETARRDAYGIREVDIQTDVIIRGSAEKWSGMRAKWSAYLDNKKPALVPPVSQESSVVNTGSENTVQNALKAVFASTVFVNDGPDTSASYRMGNDHRLQESLTLSKGSRLFPNEQSDRDFRFLSPILYLVIATSDSSAQSMKVSKLPTDDALSPGWEMVFFLPTNIKDYAAQYSFERSAETVTITDSFKAATVLDDSGGVVTVQDLDSKVALLVTPYQEGTAEISSVTLTVNNHSGSLNWARTHQYLGKEIANLAVDGRACALIHPKPSDFGYAQKGASPDAAASLGK